MAHSIQSNYIVNSPQCRSLRVLHSIPFHLGIADGTKIFVSLSSILPPFIPSCSSLPLFLMTAWHLAKQGRAAGWQVWHPSWASTDLSTAECRLLTIVESDSHTEVFFSSSNLSWIAVSPLTFSLGADPIKRHVINAACWRVRRYCKYYAKQDTWETHFSKNVWASVRWNKPLTEWHTLLSSIRRREKQNASIPSGSTFIYFIYSVLMLLNFWVTHSNLKQCRNNKLQ